MSLVPKQWSSNNISVSEHNIVINNDLVLLITGVGMYIVDGI